MKKTMKRMALYMSLMATMVMCITFAACNKDDNKEPSRPTWRDFVDIKITRCERVGAVLQIDFDVTNKTANTVEFKMETAKVTDNKGNQYGAEVSTGSSDYWSQTSVTITAKNTIKGHAKVLDFDSMNEATSIKFVLPSLITNTDCDWADCTADLQVKDNRVMANGVQTNDTNLAWSVTSCKRDNEGNLVLSFKLTNKTGGVLEVAKIEGGFDRAFDNNGNKYNVDVRWGNSGDYWSSAETKIPEGNTVEGSLLVHNFNKSATEVTIYIYNSYSNYVPSDNTVRFITIPVK